MALEEKK